jgi:glycosyltransferase involved in cell wall biosynthesis
VRVRVALVHDWLTGLRGGERVLDALAKLYPEADLYTLIHVPGSTTERIEALRIHASWLSKLPGAAHHYRKFLPLFPGAISRFRFDEYDLVISCSHAVAKSLSKPASVPHLSYCLTPMRYVWDQADQYLGRGARRIAATPLIRYLRRFDRATSDSAHVTRFVAISSEVSARIARCYERESEVVFPPVDVDRVQPNGRPSEDFYLLVGGFVPYKREGLAIDACRQLGRRLIVVGEGPTQSKLAAKAGAEVEFTGRVSDEELANLYARCKALVYPQCEDFGLVAVEAQAAGRPVIAFGRGGVLDTVIPHSGPSDAASEARTPTGIFFEEQSVDSLCDALRRFEGVQADFDAKHIRAWAESFGLERFIRQFRAQVSRVVDQT